MIRLELERSREGMSVVIRTVDGRPAAVGVLLSMLDAAREQLLGAGIPAEPVEKDGEPVEVGD